MKADHNLIRTLAISDYREISFLFIFCKLFFKQLRVPFDTCYLSDESYYLSYRFKNVKDNVCVKLFFFLNYIFMFDLYVQNRDE